MRIKSIIFVVLAGLAYFAQPCQAQRDSSSCPLPVGDTSFGLGPRIPGNYDMMDNLSPNGKILSYLDQNGDNGAHLLNLETLADTLIFVHGGLPREEDISWTAIVWCPYDSDLIALNVASLVDTEDLGVPNLYVNNIFTYRISTGVSELITPNAEGPYGNASLVESWLSGSRPGNDSLTITYKGFYGIYVRQTQTLIPQIYTGDRPSISPNHQDTITKKFIGTSTNFPNAYFLNSQQIVFPRAIDTSNPGIKWTFSPDSKLLAMEVSPFEADSYDTIFDEIWVYDVSDPTKVIDVINFQQLYCKYSLDGIWPLFITDSTLAVSMYTDGDEFSPLWEITIDGRIVRQLTFFPKFPSAVVNTPLLSNPLSIISFPNPFSQSTQIAFTSEASGYADVSLCNLLGEQVARLWSGNLDAG